MPDEVLRKPGLPKSFAPRGECDESGTPKPRACERCSGVVLQARASVPPTAGSLSPCAT